MLKFMSVGECQCKGTRQDAEALFDMYRTLTDTEYECKRWCIEEKHGTSWRFLINMNPLSMIGIGGDWHTKDHLD